MKKGLTILIPTHNCECYKLVSVLQKQAEKLCLDYEIIVFDDGSSNEDVILKNKKINELPNAKYVLRKKCRNRSVMRNRLSSLGKYEWQLQLNANVHVLNDSFLANYAEHFDDDVDIVHGTTSVDTSVSGYTRNLRLKYEYDFYCGVDIDYDNSHPYSRFRNTNLMYRARVFQQVGYDEKISAYGYEDFCFGQTLCKAGITIRYIDNPLYYSNIESNEVYLAKIERSLHTLKKKQSQLIDAALLLRRAKQLKTLHLTGAYRLLYGATKPLLRRNLLGDHPNTTLFNMYKLGYFLNL